MKENYYEVLGVLPTVTMDELKEGYLKAKNALSEDNIAAYSIMSSEDMGSNLKKIEDAYKKLSNEVTRAEYNNKMNFPPFEEKTSKLREVTVSTPESSHSIEVKADKSKEQKISKLVANNKFALKYEVDPIFEKEISDSKEYTGELLKKIREYKKVDITRMADMTRISKTHLKNLEEENISNMPARVYIRGFVYQYAKCLKINPDVVASSYMDRVDSRLNKKTVI